MAGRDGCLPHDAVDGVRSEASAVDVQDGIDGQVLADQVNGGVPPTALNARTGELTPPGIMLSARCCRRRDCSVLRIVVDGIKSSTRKWMSKTRLNGLND